MPMDQFEAKGSHKDTDLEPPPPPFPFLISSLSALRTRASCAEQIEAKLCCARCRTDYCSPECPATHWVPGGHKKACERLARARRATDLDARSSALARAAHMSGSAPDDAYCLMCLGGGDTEGPLMRGCACRGSTGWTHAGCLVTSAEAARAPPPPEPHFAACDSCSTCEQWFTGLVQLRHVVALWVKHAHGAEANPERLVAVEVHTYALETRVLGPNTPTR